MTTTLRPTGPVQQGADGARAQTFEVCDNGHPVGTVGVRTDPAFGTSAGVLHSLRIEEPNRRRGRGTIAALAGEEVLRGWGCTQARLEAPADNEPAQRLAGALGYTERSRNMLKILRGPAPALPDGVTWRPMNAGEFVRWRSVAVQEYAQNWIDQGVPEDQAGLKSESDHSSHLPDGLATEGVSFHVLVREREAVGRVWVARREAGPGEPFGYVFDVEVGEAHRGRGYGRALMHRAEGIALEAGCGRLGLHVFASNTPALRLYESLGYETTRYNLAKPL